MKTYIISTYIKGSMAMYEAGDFRLKENEPQIPGTFKRNKNAKGQFNGHEVGYFFADNGDKYLVFIDHSVRLIK